MSVIKHLYMTFSRCKKWLRFFEPCARDQQARLEMKAAGEVCPATNGCFVAGTLVHTREGLVPIEKIQVGDWVLSQPEERGERACKRVTKTFSFDDKKVYSVDFATKDHIGTLVATGNHPFFVKGEGWVAAESLYVGCVLELPEGWFCDVFNVSLIYHTEMPGVGWIEGGFGLSDADGIGRIIDMRNGKVAIDYDHQNSVRNDAVVPSEGTAFSTRVYNLEVEDFHTYYVGDLGVWVHNTNCGGMDVSLVTAGEA